MLRTTTVDNNSLSSQTSQFFVSDHQNGFGDLLRFDDSAKRLFLSHVIIVFLDFGIVVAFGIVNIRSNCRWVDGINFHASSHQVCRHRSGEMVQRSFWHVVGENSLKRIYFLIFWFKKKLGWANDEALVIRWGDPLAPLLPIRGGVLRGSSVIGWEERSIPLLSTLRFLPTLEKNLEME